MAVHTSQYPLIGGALIFALLKLAGAKKPVSRAGYNIYNSGIATLTAAAMLEGIIEIAGSGSRWITVIRYAGATLTAAGIGSYFWGTLKRIGALKRK